MKHNLYYNLIKLGVHIGHSKVDWNPILNSFMAGMTKSNYLIFNINKSAFFLKRALLFHKLLGHNNGSFIIYYAGSLSNYTDMLEGYLNREGLIPNSYPFLYNIVKPGFFSNWKKNYKSLIKSFYKVIFYNQQFFISLVNKVANDYVNNNRINYKKIPSLARKIKYSCDKYVRKKIYKMYFYFHGKRKKLLRLSKRTRNFFYFSNLKRKKKKNKVISLLSKSIDNILLDKFKRPSTKNLYKLKQLIYYIHLLRFSSIEKKNIFLMLLNKLLLFFIDFKKLLRKKKREQILKLILLKRKKRRSLKKRLKKLYLKLKELVTGLQLNIKYKYKIKKKKQYSFNKNMNNYLFLKQRSNKKELSDELVTQSFKMFYYNIYNLFLKFSFRRIQFKSNNLDLTPNEAKLFVRFIKFILIFRYIKRIKRIPNSVLLLNPELNESQFTDFNFLRVTITGILDTNSYPKNISYFIPSNDDSIIVLLFYIKLIIFSFENGKKNFYIKNLVNQLNLFRYIFNKKKKKYNNEGNYHDLKYDPSRSIELKYKRMKKYFEKLKSKYYAGGLKKEKKEETKRKKKLKLILNKSRFKLLLSKLFKLNKKLFKHVSYRKKLRKIYIYKKKIKRNFLSYNKNKYHNFKLKNKKTDNNSFLKFKTKQRNFHSSYKANQVTKVANKKKIPFKYIKQNEYNKNSINKYNNKWNQSNIKHNKYDYRFDKSYNKYGFNKQLNNLTDNRFSSHFYNKNDKRNNQMNKYSFNNKSDFGFNNHSANKVINTYNNNKLNYRFDNKKRNNHMNQNKLNNIYYKKNKPLHSDQYINKYGGSNFNNKKNFLKNNNIKNYNETNNFKKQPQKNVNILSKQALFKNKKKS